MNISPVVSSSSYSDTVVPQASVRSSHQQQAAQVPGTAGRNTEDSVQFSQAARVQQMSEQGQTASAIASTTGLTVSEVDSDLGISTASFGLTVAAPAGHGGRQSAAATAAAATTATPTTRATTKAAPAAASDSKASTAAPAVPVKA